MIKTCKLIEKSVLAAEVREFSSIAGRVEVINDAGVVKMTDFQSLVMNRAIYLNALLTI